MTSWRQVPGPGGWVVDVGGGQAPSARAQNVSGGWPPMGSRGVVRANFSLNVRYTRISEMPASLVMQRGGGTFCCHTERRPVCATGSVCVASSWCALQGPS